MGVIKRGILGGFSGSVGNIVGTSWKGIAVMKAKPLSVANPNTAAQIVVRTKMRNIVDFSKAILVGVIKPLNDRWASGQSGFNLFVQRNIGLFAGVNPSPPADLILSQGAVTGFANLSAVKSVGTPEVNVYWDNNSGDGDADPNDQAFGVAKNETNGEFAIISGTDPRAGMAGLFVFPSNVSAPDVIRVWVSYRRNDGSKVSNSSYVLST